jgi:hypothetical protein
MLAVLLKEIAVGTTTVRRKGEALSMLPTATWAIGCCCPCSTSVWTISQVCGPVPPSPVWAQRSTQSP